MNFYALESSLRQSQPGGHIGEGHLSYRQRRVGMNQYVMLGIFLYLFLINALGVWMI